MKKTADLETRDCLKAKTSLEARDRRPAEGRTRRKLRSFMSLNAMLCMGSLQMCGDLACLMVDAVPDTGDQPFQMFFLELLEEAEILIRPQQFLHYPHEPFPIDDVFAHVFHPYINNPKDGSSSRLSF